MPGIAAWHSRVICPLLLFLAAVPEFNVTVAEFMDKMSALRQVRPLPSDLLLLVCARQPDKTPLAQHALQPTTGSATGLQ